MSKEILEKKIQRRLNDASIKVTQNPKGDGYSIKTPIGDMFYFGDNKNLSKAADFFVRAYNDTKKLIKGK